MNARRAEVLRASPRMFDSDLLDRLSRVHPAVPLVIFVPAIAVLFGARRAATSATLEVVGPGARRLPLLDAHRVLDAPPRVPLRARGRASARGCTGSSTACTTTTPTTRCAWSCRRRSACRWPLCSSVRSWLVLGTPDGVRCSAPASWPATWSYDMTPLPPAPPQAAHAARQAGCASCTCATTSRTTRAASASARRSGTTSSGRRLRRGRAAVVPHGGRSTLE